jgi:hypothetical protein
MRKALDSTIEMALPNEEIEIFNGILEMNGKSQFGRVYHQWFPFDQTRISVPNFSGDIFNLIGLTVEVTFGDNIKGDFFISSINEGESRFVSGILNSILIKKEILNEKFIKFLDFNLINFRPYFGSVFEYKPKSYITGELEFIAENCNVLIQSRFSIENSKKLLTDKGGFLITHNGRINFKKSMSSENIGFYLKRLSNFLSFLNGRRCGPRFIEALTHDGQTIIKDYTLYFCDPYKYVQSWMPFNLDNNFFDLWSSFLQLTRDEDDFERIDLIIHWYLEALNNSGFVNGSIILLQNSFEILFSWLAQEKKLVKKIGKDDNQKKWASNKIRSLFSHYGIPFILPPDYNHFFEKFDISNNEDFAYVFTLIRNAFVHFSEEKKLDLKKLDNYHWHLLNTGIFYFEILLLRILGYEGKIRSRILKSGYSGERQVSILNPFLEIPS